MAIIAAGTPTPEFTLRDERGEPFTQEHLAGDRATVLVFYPFAFSPVCTDQFQIYEEVQDDIADAGGRILGVSCDATDSQVAFKERLGVSTPQLSDFEPKGAASRTLGAYFEPGGMSTRALVAFTPDGSKVAWSWEGEHPGVLPGADLVLEGVRAATA